MVDKRNENSQLSNPVLLKLYRFNVFSIEQ